MAFSSHLTFTKTYKCMKSALLLFFGLMAGQLFAQRTTVSGVITDASNGQPLIGATVVVGGSSVGTVTDADGSYTISTDATELVFSFTGYVPQTLAIQGRTRLDVALQADITILEQVVVTGTRRSNRVQTETPVPVDVINVAQSSLPSARMDLTSMLNYSAPSFNFNKQSGSDGADHIDLATLRGLGPDQTLVLVNGKRRHQTAFIAVFGTRGRGNSGTDLSAIPAAAIERVEILRDGASAQYGSDAIAGVINLVLKKSTNLISADFGFSGYLDNEYNPAQKPELGQYVYDKKMDGMAYGVNVNTGMGIGKNGGFLNATLSYQGIGKTYRQELDGKLPTSIYRRAHGDGSMSNFGGFFNAELPFANSKTAFYVFGGGNTKNSDAYAFTRNFSARPERFPTDANGNLIPVEGIIFTTSDGEQYYNPHIQTEIKDRSIALGVHGSTESAWAWDLSNATGYNDFHFFGDKTFNAGLGASKTSFDDGGYNFLQNTSNLNFSKEYDVMAGLNLAFGGEFRFERYTLYAGEEASYKNYNPEKATGAQGFPGYQPGDEVEADRNTVGAYADVELDLTDAFLLSGAVRVENYSDFGLTANGKLAARYKLGGNFNLRGSFSTGFRAPSLQQINFSSTFTTVQGQDIFEVKIAPNYSPITEAAGIPELQEEKSTNGSVGFNWKPLPELTFTVDAYQVKVTDRIVLSGFFNADDTTLDPKLTSALQDLNVASAQFFANAVNTTNQGIDIVVDYNKKFGGDNRFRALVAANFQKMTIDEINVPTLLDDTPEHRANFLSDREQKFILASAPGSKIASTLEYGTGPFSFGTRLTYFGEVELYGYGEDATGIAPMVPTDADPNIYVPDLYVYSGKLVADLFASYRFGKNLTLYLGVDNVANVHPDLGYVPVAAGWAFNNETGGPWDAVQMGGNGRRVFTRLAVNF